jgi:hypothetical protein
VRRTSLLLAALITAFPYSSRAQVSRDQLSLVFRGEAALQRQEIAAATEAFRAAARDTNVRRRAAAERMLGMIDWRFRQQFVSARMHYGAALATGADTAATLAELARLAVAQGRYNEGFETARRALVSAESDIVRRAAALELGRAVVEPALARKLDAESAPPEASGTPDSSAVRAAVHALRERVRTTPGRVEDARLLLLAALLAGDGPTALEAIRSYYLVDLDGTLNSPIPRALSELDTLLREWPGDAATPAQRSRLAVALGRARLFEAAALVAPASSELVAYAAYSRRVGRLTEDYYRRTLFGLTRTDELTRSYYRAGHDLWPRLEWRGTVPRYYPAGLEAELARRFGTLVQLGITGGFFDLHFGHIIGTKTLRTTQYGHRASLNFVLLDGMVSNGLQTWTWEEGGGHGGWQRNDTIVQVRPVFVEHTIALWLTADPTRRESERRYTAADSAADWAVAARDSLAFLPGVAARLRRDGREALIDSLRSAGLSGSSLGAAFVTIVSRLSREGSIIAHEGRHAIDDKLSPKISADEREFRAKLSEIAFAAHPKLLMSSIVHPNIGDQTPHGRANLRIVAGLVRWMRAHAAQIRGLDSSRPMLPQLPLLDEDQLRAAFRAMDPLARNL